MYEIIYTNRFKKSLKKCDKRGVIDRQHLEDVIDILQNQGELPMTYRPHILSGNYAGIWECHVQSDLLMLWIQDTQKNTIEFIDIGTHSDLF